MINEHKWINSLPKKNNSVTNHYPIDHDKWTKNGFQKKDILIL